MGKPGQASPRPSRSISTVFASVTAFLICLAALVANAGGVLLTVLQLPGNWIIVFGTALVAWWGWDVDPELRIVGWPVLIVLLVVAVLAEVLELVLSAAGAKKAGGTRRGAMLALVGGIVGAIAGSLLIPIPIVGTVIGAAAGSGVGALCGDRSAGRNWSQATQSAKGAAVGRLTATLVKALAAVALWLIAFFGLVF